MACRFAVFVVGSFRDEAGWLVDFGGELAVRAPLQGFRLYTEFVFTPRQGTGAKRATIFESNRKAVRVHQVIKVSQWARMLADR